MFFGNLREFFYEKNFVKNQLFIFLKRYDFFKDLKDSRSADIFQIFVKYSQSGTKNVLGRDVYCVCAEENFQKGDLWR